MNIGFNKPIKTRLHKKWDDWMTDGERTADGVAKEPSRKMVAEWCVDTYTSMPESIGRNTLMKRGFEWF